MEMLLSCIVLAVAVTASLCRIMLSAKVLVRVADPSVGRGSHDVSWGLWQVQRSGDGHVWKQAARASAAEQVKRFKSQLEVAKASSGKVGDFVRSILSRTRACHCDRPGVGVKSSGS